MLIDQPRFDSRRACADDVDRINVARKSCFIGGDAQPLKRDLIDSRIRLGDADDMRVDYYVEVRRQSESLRVTRDLPFRIRHDREFVPRRLEPLERLERARTHDAPQRRLAMYRAKFRRAFLEFLFR